MTAPSGTPRASEVVFARTMEITDSNPLGKVHGGVVMRAVDSAAGTAAARHCGTICVTAAIDGLSFLGPVEVGDILIVQARVNDVGRTSLEVGVKVEAEPWQGGERRHTTSAYLLMVALDDDGRPTSVPRLHPETADDRRRQQQARIRRELRTERLRRLNAYDGPGGGDSEGDGGAPDTRADQGGAGDATADGAGDAAPSGDEAPRGQG